MQCDYRLVKAVAKALLCLWCQADLGNQHQCLPTVAQHFIYALQIDFGFAAAGNTVQQIAIKTMALDCIHSSLL